MSQTTSHTAEPPPPAPPPSPVDTMKAAAKAAKLRYVSDSRPRITASRGASPCQTVLPSGPTTANSRSHGSPAGVSTARSTTTPAHPLIGYDVSA